MDYEELIYKIITMFQKWGVWFPDAAVYCKGRKYEPCEAVEVRTQFGILKHTKLSEYDPTEKMEFACEVPEEYELYISGNSALSELYNMGMFGVKLSDLPYDTKEYAISIHPELMDRFYEEYDEEEIRAYPEEYGLPADIEFDSADEYNALIEEFIEESRVEYIENLYGTVTFANDLEADLSALLIDYELEYTYCWAGLFVGRNKI